MTLAWREQRWRALQVLDPAQPAGSQETAGRQAICMERERNVKTSMARLSNGGKATPRIVDRRFKGSDVHGDAAAALPEAADELPTLTVDPLGIIRHCNPAGAHLFNYRHRELMGRSVALLLPQLADLRLMESGQANQHLRFLCRVGRRFQGVTKDGRRFSSELFLRVLDNGETDQLSLIVRPTDDEPDKNLVSPLEIRATGVRPSPLVPAADD